MRRLLALAVLGCAASLGGCALSGMDTYSSAASKAFYYRDPALTQRLGAAGALAVLPASAGRILEVDQTRYSNGLVQKIILSGGRHGAGDNEIDVTVQVNHDPDGKAINPITLPASDDASIADELSRRFPTVAMHDVPVLLQNHYGPYGLAAGRTATGERCIYAWQSFRNFGHRNRVAPATLVGGLLAPAEPGTIRVRLCQKGVSADALGGLMNALYLTGSGGSAQQVLVDPQIDRPPGISQNALGATSVTALGSGFSGYRMPQKKVVLERHGAIARRIVVIRRRRHPVHMVMRPAHSEPLPYQLPPVSQAALAHLVILPRQPSVPAPAIPAATSMVVPAPAASLKGLPQRATLGPQGRASDMGEPEVPLPRAATRISEPSRQGASAAATQDTTSQLLRAHTLQGSGS